MNVKPLIYLSLLLAPFTAQAIEPGPVSAQQQATEGWLSLQIQGQVASSNPQALSVSEREEGLKRWLDSYKHPISGHFEQGDKGSFKGK